MTRVENRFSLLDSFDSSPQNESRQPLFPHPNSIKKCPPHNPTLAASKLERHPDNHYGFPRPSNRVPYQRNRINKPSFVQARGRGDNFEHQDNRPRPNLPPRLQRQSIESRGAAPRPCSGPIHPCLIPPPPCSSELLSAQLKQEVFAMLQLPATSCPDTSLLTSQPSCTPISSLKDPPLFMSVPNRSSPCGAEPHDAVLSSTLTRRTPIVDTCPPVDARETSGTPHTADIISRTPTEADTLLALPEKASVSLPPPPGLSKPVRGRYQRGGRTSVKSTKKGHNPNQIVDHSDFDRHNGPVVAAQVISPPPTGVASHVKLPASSDAPHVPPSPTISASSSSEEDLSGGSSVLFSSDTSFTSVDSNVSSMASQRYHRRIPREICRNWLKGFPCFKNPCPYLHEKQNPELSQKPEPLYVTTVSDHIKVRFDQGFEVREVLTGFESRWVHLGNIARTVTSIQLNKLLSPYNVESVNLPESSTKPVTAKVQFTSAADAMKAVTDLNGTEFASRTITAKLAINNSIRGSTVLVDTVVQLVWPCPSRDGYAGYDTLKEAKVAIDSLNGFPMEHSVVSAQLYEGLPCVGAYNVIFRYLPATVTEQSLRKFANSKAVMLGRPNYASLEKAIHSIRSRLEGYGTVTVLDVISPPYKDGLVKAWAHYASPAEARAAQDDFDRRRPGVIGHTTISCRHVLSVSHVLSAASYRKMREDIGWLRWSWQRRYGPTVSIRERVKDSSDDDAPAYIRLSSEQPELLSGLKCEFEQLLHGETVTLDKKPVWDDFLIAQAGQVYIAQVQSQYPGVDIQVQKDRRAISLWGPIVMRHRARQDIVRKLMELKAQQFWKIPLSGKLFSIFRSAEIFTLRDLLGPENCILDFAERVLAVRGNDLAYRTACKAVEDAQNRQDGAPSSGIICPVCFGEPVVPVSLACGHQWCRACLTGYLTSAVENKIFPLRCLGNDATCMQRIPLGLSRKLLSATDFSAVIEAAFWVHVHGRPDEFYHCPTPDCSQVYRAGPPNVVLQCPSCLVRICPACRIQYHDGMSCEERDVAEDKLFNEWTSSHDVKSCPGCKAPIERSEGCNHMTCTRCQTHSCWECLATFPRGQGIYEHMRIQHGGIGL